MFCFGKLYLLIVRMPVNSPLVCRLKNRSEEEPYRVTFNLLSRPLNSGLVLQKLYFDREAGIISDDFQDKLMKYKGIETIDHTNISKDVLKFINKNRGVEVVSTGATSGIDIVERNIRNAVEVSIVSYLMCYLN